MKIPLSLALLMGLMAAALAQPVITPANLTVNAGASFDFTATDANALAFQWVFDGTNISGATNSELYVDNPGTNQAGLYWVVATYPDNSIRSNSATLNVLQGTIVNFAISTFADGSTNSLLVELFDHDKPATSENFVHYIRSGAYSNMFFDRLIPGFVLQGGDYDADDRTNSAPDAVPGMTTFSNTFSIYQYYVQGSNVSNPGLPPQIDNEFYVGPYVSNVKGTLALALPSGNANGGTSAFFFNLVDNSDLDSQQFTVFGRVIGGTNVLDYFNNTDNFFKLPASSFPPNLVFTNNPFTNGIFDLVCLDTNATSFTDLPVNFYGTNIPANSNLFFVQFSFPNSNAQPYIDTIPPTATITYPPPNLLVTNGIDFTVQGTAYDNVGLAYVDFTFYPQNGANGGSPFSAPATGTTNWSLDVDSAFPAIEPGIYNVSATPQDGAGNVGASAYQTNLIITGVVTNGVGTVVLTNRSTYPAAGSVVADAVGAYMESGYSYSLLEQPGTNQLFVSWSFNDGYPDLLSTNVYFTMSDGFVATATFLSNAIPGSIAFTYPPPQGTANATNGVFQILGTITGLTNAPVSITCQLYNYSTAFAVGSPMQTSGTTNWTLPVTNVADGQYYVQAIAQDSLGRQTLITNSFTLQTVDELTVRLNGPGDITTNFNGQYLVPGDTYSMTATPAANAVFESWSSDGNTSLNPVESFTMSLNLSLTATFISNDIPGSIAFTYPKPGKPAYATNGVLAIQGTITGPASPPVSITCQLFSSNNQQLLGSPLQTSSTNIWSLQTNLPNGQYYVQAIAQDSLGRTTLITNAFSLQTVNKLTVLQNGPGVITTNLDGQYLVAGKTYSMKAKAAKNCVFETWSDGLNATLDPVETFTMSSNLTLTATFVSNGIPGTISFTDPHANAQLTNPVVTLAGRTKSSIAATQIVCQLFLNSNSLAPPSPAGIANDTWSAPQTNLAPGLSSLAPGAYTAVATAYDATGKSALIRENFDVLARLTVAASTNLVVPPVLDTNGVNTNIVTVASPLQAGAVSLKSKYLKVGAPATIRAAPKPGYLFAYWVLNGVANPNNPYSFSLTTNETITANFAPNYYSKVSGTYYGLFYPSYTYATPDNAGYFTMEILSGGATTIDLSFPNYAYKFEGELPYYCGVQPEVTSGLHGSPSDPLIMSFGMDLTNFSGAFTGYVYDAKGTWGANLTAYRAATKLATSSAVAPGRYVLTIPGDHTNANNQPGGDSYAVYSISDSGAVALAGSLADNTTFTRSTGVSTNGIWPLYVPLYNTHGIILGWQTNSSPTNFSGQVEWDKPARTGAYYPSGFTNVFSATPANYTPPAADTHYQIVFNGGALAGPLTNFLTVTSARLFTPDPAQAGLKVTLTPATGAITGQFMDPSGNTVKKIRGAFISPGSGGSGYILDADDETGYFEISLLP